jgi:integrase
LLFRPGGTERPRQRALDDQELASLLANVDEVTKRAKRSGIAIRLILLTAVRRSELTGARSGPRWIWRPRRRFGTSRPSEPKPALLSPSR